MAKPKDFSSDISNLPVVDKVKRVVEGFIDAECTPSAWFGPNRADRLRREILRHVRICAEGWSSPPENVSTLTLSRELRRCADGNRTIGRRGIAARLELLADLIKDISLSRRERGNRFKRKSEK